MKFRVANCLRGRMLTWIGHLILQGGSQQRDITSCSIFPAAHSPQQLPTPRSLPSRSSLIKRQGSLASSRNSHIKVISLLEQYRFVCNQGQAEERRRGPARDQAQDGREEEQVGRGREEGREGKVMACNKLSTLSSIRRRMPIRLAMR